LRVGLLVYDDDILPLTFGSPWPLFVRMSQSLVGVPVLLLIEAGRPAVNIKTHRRSKDDPMGQAFKSDLVFLDFGAWLPE